VLDSSAAVHLMLPETVRVALEKNGANQGGSRRVAEVPYR
jgi:hypothetical protein